MHVLVTGAAGNLGAETIRQLLEAGHRVRGFDLRSRASEKAIARLPAPIDMVWGDVCEMADVRRALEGQAVVLHNAGIVPPMSESKPELARRVNVDGTRNIIDAALAMQTPPKVLLTSSIAVFGPCQDEEPPRTAAHESRPTDHYSHHKVECEKMLRESGLTWSIFRIGASPPVAGAGGSPELLRFMFRHSLDSRVEFVHPRDVGYAQARIVDVDAAWDKVLLIGGGARCQIHNRDLLQRMFETLGIGALPEEAFADLPLYGDWLDTRESQALLGFQQRTFDDFLDEIRANIGLARFGSMLAGPLVRMFLVRYSETYKARKASAR